MNAVLSNKVRTWLEAVVLALLLCVLVVDTAAADETPVDPPDRVARLSYTEGDVSVAPAGTEEWAEAILNRPLTSGDRVWVDANARAELQVGTGLIHLDSGTSFGFLELDRDVTQVSLTEGAATLLVRRRGEEDTIEVRTPNGTVSLLHPGEYTIEVDPERDETLVKVRSGDAEVLAGDDGHVVREGEALVFRGVENVAIDSHRLGERTAFERWANERARELQDTESSRYVSSEVVGYEDLDDHGEWVYEREYGHVWRPLYVSIDWAPYRYGRWVWVAPWGYTWIDDARWGFAPFHYGRWAHIHNRWYWVPGPRHLRPVYSPAFVAWTYHDRHVGWFPLSPRDVYVPGYRHSPHYVRRVNECNTRWIDRRHLHALDRRPGARFEYRFARNADAITMVDRDRFLAGRSLSGARFHVNPHDAEQWRAQPRPPALTPYRETVLGGNARTNVRELRDNDRQRELFGRSRVPSRIPFEAERRAVEANGGQPLSRTELQDRGPKGSDDFRGNAWREQRRSSRSLTTAEASAPRAPHELGSVRSPLPSGQHTWRTQRPDSAIDSVARDRQLRDSGREPDRYRRADGSSRLHTAPRSWSSGQADVMRERVQREHGSMRSPAPSVQRSAPLRIERSAPAHTERSQPARTQGEARSAPSPRTDGGRAGRQGGFHSGGRTQQQ